MKSLKKLLAPFLALTMVFALGACAPADEAPATDDVPATDDAADPAGDDVAAETDYSAIIYTPGETMEGAEGTLVVAMSADYAPYEFIDINSGNIAGFDVGLAKEIAKDLNMNLEIKNIPFDSCITEMNLGKADVVISGLSPDPERDAEFSDIYYSATQAAVIRVADADKYTDAASLAGMPVAAQSGSIQADLVAEEFPESSLLALQLVPDVVMNVKTSKAEAAVMEEPVAQGYVTNNDDLMIAFAVPYEETGSAVAVKKGNTELLAEVNASIARITEENLMETYVMLANELSNAQ